MKVTGTGLLDPGRSPDSGNGRRRARRGSPHDVRALKDLARKNGPPLTTGELAQMIGMSQTFIRKEISNGYLRAARIGHGRKCVLRIAVSEARRYVRKLGLF